MKIETKFSNGNVVYGVQKLYHTDKWQVVGPLTIGQVMVSITDSPGVDGQNTYKEQYMCVETSIGSGILWSVDQLFVIKVAAQDNASRRNNRPSWYL